eukprot:3009821-Rhodomonas_salina.2
MHDSTKSNANGCGIRCDLAQGPHSLYQERGVSYLIPQRRSRAVCGSDAALYGDASVVYGRDAGIYAESGAVIVSRCSHLSRHQC